MVEETPSSVFQPKIGTSLRRFDTLHCHSKSLIDGSDAVQSDNG